MTGPTFPGHRARYLPAMTRAQIEALPGRASSIVIIPVGSIEQHGPHLSVGVDALLAQAWLDRALARLPASAPVWAGPAITYAKSNEHAGFPGTIAISARTLGRVLSAIARQVRALGFGTLAVFNTHGGNTAVVLSMLREIEAKTGLTARLLERGWKPNLPPSEAAFGYHAGHFETALMLAVAPHLVRMDRAVNEAVAGDENSVVRPEKAPVAFSWKMSDLSRSGVLGDATAATREEGEAWLEAGAAALAERIMQLCEQAPGD